MALGNNIGIASERGKNKATRFGSVPPLEVWASGASSRPVGAAACGAPIPTINTPLYIYGGLQVGSQVTTTAGGNVSMACAFDGCRYKIALSAPPHAPGTTFYTISVFKGNNAQNQTISVINALGGIC